MFTDTKLGLISLFFCLFVFIFLKDLVSLFQRIVKRVELIESVNKGYFQIIKSNCNGNIQKIIRNTLMKC